MNYKESLLSKSVYLARKTYFDGKKATKKARKIWRQRKEYFSKDYYKSKKFNADEKVNNSSYSARVNEPKLKVNRTADVTYDYTGLSEKLAVYTCIFGGYDMVCEPLVKSKWCDYYIITDGEVPEKSVWKKIEPPKPDGYDEWNDSRKNRYFKMHPEAVFPEYRYSLYVDGNIRLLSDPYAYIPLMQKKKKFIGIHKYPMSNCTYKNAEFLKSLNLVVPEESDRQMQQYESEGFPKCFGYFECGMLLREHNYPKCRDIMNTWWEQYLTQVRRDQQCFPYSLWKNGFGADSVFILGTNLQKTNPRIKFYRHERPHFLVKGDEK